MIPLDQQRRLVALAGSVSSPFDLVRYDVEAGRVRMEIVVMPEPSPPMALVSIRIGDLLDPGRRGGWVPFHRSLVATGDN